MSAAVGEALIDAVMVTKERMMAVIIEEMPIMDAKELRVWEDLLAKGCDYSTVWH